MSDAKHLSVPADFNVVLYPVSEDDVKLNNVPYREAVGSLIFLSIVSRSDITYAINSVSKYLNNHNADHWRAVKKIFQYVAGTFNYSIEYQSDRNESELTGFSDAYYASDVETRRSTTGYLFNLGNRPITWTSQRQD